MPAFKSDEEFLRFISMGAVGVRRVMADLQAQGRKPLLLERGSNDFKLWKQHRIKGMRMPDILCVDTGRRIESRAKTAFEISGSHSARNPERAWDYGLDDADYLAIPVCHRSGGRPIDWEASELVQYALVGDLRKARAQGLTNLSEPKGAPQGSEVRIIWPCSVASSPGEVKTVTPERLQYVTSDTKRTISLALEKAGKALTPLVHVGQKVLSSQVLASVVPVMQAVAAEPKADLRDYVKGLTSLAPGVRFSAAKALSLFNEEAALTALANHLQKSDEHVFVRLEVAASLARHGNASGWGFLEQTLAGEFPSHRLEAVIVLAEIGIPQARRMLAQVLLDGQQEAEVRAGAAWALGEHHDRDSARVLIHAFAETSLSIRIEAARALAKLVPLAQGDILKQFGEADAQHRLGLAWALSKSGAPSMPELLAAAADEDARQWACYIIGTQEPAQHIAQIEQVRQSDPEVYFAVTVLWKILTSWVFDLKEYG